MNGLGSVPTSTWTSPRMEFEPMKIAMAGVPKDVDPVGIENRKYETVKL